MSSLKGRIRMLILHKSKDCDKNNKSGYKRFRFIILDSG